MNSHHMRLFVAIDIPAPIITELASIQCRLLSILEPLAANTDIIIKPVKHEQFHSTLLFIGSATLTERLAIESTLNHIVTKPFDITIGPIGIFQVADGFVLWCAAQDHSQFTDLADNIAHALKTLGYSQEKEWIGHITLARIKYKNNDKQRINPTINSTICTQLQAIPVPRLTFTVHEFVLKQSVSSPDGPLYTTIHTFKTTDGP